jgi:hypothetical protein
MHTPRDMNFKHIYYSLSAKKRITQTIGYKEAIPIKLPLLAGSGSPELQNLMDFNGCKRPEAAIKKVMLRLFAALFLTN